jgi:hypothetical protein
VGEGGTVGAVIYSLLLQFNSAKLPIGYLLHSDHLARIKACLSQVSAREHNASADFTVRMLLVSATQATAYTSVSKLEADLQWDCTRGQRVLVWQPPANETPRTAPQTDHLAFLALFMLSRVLEIWWLDTEIVIHYCRNIW